MWKTIEPKVLSFQIEEENKNFIDEYLRRKPYTFSAFIRELIQKETIKYMPNAGLETVEYKFKPRERLDKNVKYIIVTLQIEAVDLKVLKYLSRKTGDTVSHIVRELVNNKIKEIKNER